jgi:hypothetical protein
VAGITIELLLSPQVPDTTKFHLQITLKKLFTTSKPKENTVSLWQKVFDMFMQDSRLIDHLSSCGVIHIFHTFLITCKSRTQSLETLKTLQPLFIEMLN